MDYMGLDAWKGPSGGMNEPEEEEKYVMDNRVSHYMPQSRQGFIPTVAGGYTPS